MGKLVTIFAETLPSPHGDWEVGTYRIPGTQVNVLLELLLLLLFQRHKLFFV